QPGTPPPMVPQALAPTKSDLSNNHRSSTNGPCPASGAGAGAANLLKCDYCAFQTESKQDFSNHLLEHVMHEKQTLVSNRRKSMNTTRKAPSASLVPQSSSVTTP